MFHVGQTEAASELLQLFHIIRNKSEKYFHPNNSQTPILYRRDRSEYEDDYWRHQLKNISGCAFPKVFSSGPAYMLFTHLHSLTGKCPFTKEKIIKDITAWVSNTDPTGQVKDIDHSTVQTTLDDVFPRWYHGESGGSLNFRDYCNDFVRWGTSGGAPKIDIAGETYRTKWAWAYANSVLSDGNINHDRDLYQQALLQDIGYAGVALKEEAQKTREIITTPMPSYMRQSYLLYRWGKPPINSPISSGAWVSHFEKISPAWYGCLDGEKFDQTIPAWFVLTVVDRLGNLDNETRKVADEELQDLHKLRVEWNGMTWAWKAGVLSGWRTTSVLGTLASVAAFNYITKASGTFGGIQYGALGDDLILFSHNH